MGRWVRVGFDYAAFGTALLVTGLVFTGAALGRDGEGVVTLLVVPGLGIPYAAVLYYFGLRKRMIRAFASVVDADDRIDLVPKRQTVLRSATGAILCLALIGMLGFFGHQLTISATLAVGFGGSMLLGARQIRALEGPRGAVLVRTETKAGLRRPPLQYRFLATR